MCHLRLARTNLEIFAKTLGLTHATRYINALALGPLRDYEKTVGESPGALDRADRYGVQITFDAHKISKSSDVNTSITAGVSPTPLSATS
jgi:hypothetical protein